MTPRPMWADGDGFTTGDGYAYVTDMAAVAVAVAVTDGRQNIAHQSWTGLIASGAEDVDTDGLHSLASFQSRFIPSYPGYYTIEGSASFGASTAGTVRQVAAIKNGSTATFYGFHRAMDLSASYATVVECASAPVACDGEGDYLELAVYQDAARDLTMGVTRIGVYRLRGL